MDNIDDLEDLLIAEFETYWDRLHADAYFKNSPNKDEIKDACERMFQLGFATGLKKSLQNMARITKEITGEDLDISVDEGGTVDEDIH